MKSRERESSEILRRARIQKSEADNSLDLRTKSSLLTEAKRMASEKKLQQGVNMIKLRSLYLEKQKEEASVSDQKQNFKYLIEAARSNLQWEKMNFQAFRSKKLESLQAVRDEEKKDLEFYKAAISGINSACQSPKYQTTFGLFSSQNSSARIVPTNIVPSTPAFFDPSPHKQMKRHPVAAKQYQPLNFHLQTEKTSKNSSPQKHQSPLMKSQPLQNPLIMTMPFQTSITPAVKQSVKGTQSLQIPVLGITRNMPKQGEKLPKTEPFKPDQVDEANLSDIMAKGNRTLADSEMDRSLLTEYRLMNEMKTISDIGDDTPGRKVAQS